jgi:putative transposase
MSFIASVSREYLRRKLQNAYAMVDYADAKRALERLHHELMHLNPSAARSLEEGLEETLTVFTRGTSQKSLWKSRSVSPIW